MKLPSLFSNSGNENAPTLGWVPANLFFTKTIPLPEELEKDEVESFTELELEEMSPFPIEQLAWGYSHDEVSKQVFVFAAVKPRIPAKILDRWEELNHIYPSFMPLLEQRFETATVKALWHENVVTFAFYDGENPFPVRFEHQVLELEDDEAGEETETPEDEDAVDPFRAKAFTAFKEMRALHLKDTLSIEDGLWTVEEGKETDDDSIFINCRLVRESEEAEAAEPESRRIKKENGLWAADVRDTEYIEKQQKIVLLEQKLWKVYQVSGIVAALLMIALIFNVVIGLLVNVRNDKFIAQEQAASNISENIGYLESLQQFSGDQFEPFKILEALNDLRPRNIYFKSTQAQSSKDGNSILVQGTGESVNQVNAYAEKIASTQQFSLDGDPNVDTARGGEITFKIKLNVHTVAEPEPEEEEGQDVAVNE